MKNGEKKELNPLLDVQDVLDEEEIEDVLSTFNEEESDTEETPVEDVEEPEVQAESSEALPEAALVQVSVRIPRVLRTRAKIVAARNQITLSTMIIRGLEIVLDQLKVMTRK